MFCEGHHERRIEEYKLALYTAWHTEAFARRKKLPDLDRKMKALDKKQNRPERQSPQEMRAVALDLAKRFGGKVTYG